MARRKWIICGILSLTALYYYFPEQVTYLDPTFQVRYDEKCTPPLLNAWDPSIMNFVEEKSALYCKRTQEDFTVLFENGTLWLNQTAVHRYDTSVSCYYRCYDRVENDDENLFFDEFKELTNVSIPGCEFIETYCARSNFPYTKIYYNNHNQIIPKKRIAAYSYRPSVILFVLDSVSYSNWKRSMPKSDKVLRDSYGSHFFDGMTKVGDHSFPNAIGFLAGVKESEFGELHGYFDNHSLVWKDFSLNNYTTFYAEDYPAFNLFYYLAKGFKQRPVDHYFRPFWLNVFWSYLHRRSQYLCYGNTPKHRLQLNYLSQLLKKYPKQPLFALNWLTELGHDYMNNVQLGDDDIAEFLTNHLELLKDSFFIVMSDHGHRFDAIRSTSIGRFEERLPVFSMHIPKYLTQRFPQLSENVRQNSQKITSFWDVYATLRHIIELNNIEWKQLERLRITLKRGRSLLDALPDRSCNEADIPEEFCICIKETQRDLNSSQVKNAANTAVAYINTLLSAHPQCSVLSISRTLSAANMLEKNSSELLIRVTFEALPSEALFEALLRPHVGGSFSVVGDINRINRYGNQSLCVHTQELRKYCFCQIK